MNKLRVHEWVSKILRVRCHSIFRTIKIRRGNVFRVLNFVYPSRAFLHSVSNCFTDRGTLHAEHMSGSFVFHEVRTSVRPILSLLSTTSVPPAGYIWFFTLSCWPFEFFSSMPVVSHYHFKFFNLDTIRSLLSE